MNRIPRYNQEKYRKNAENASPAFNPALNEIETVYKKNLKKVLSGRPKPLILKEPVHSSFIMPVSIKDIKKTLKAVPRGFLSGLDAVFLLGGSNKQAKAFSLFRFGTYWKKCIFIHAFPKAFLTVFYENPLKPSFLEEYKRYRIKTKKEFGGISICFTPESLKNYYLGHILMHEMGHHVCGTGKNIKKEEGFAEWFSTQFGYRLFRR
jgi:hypothetical protein